MVRFDKPCCRFHGAMRYFAEHMAKQDYLTEKGQVQMTWQGEGAVRLGLHGQVQEDHFARLCAGRNPFTDKKLTPRDNGSNRRVCYFGQISAPKDVSIAHLVGGDQRIAGWWEESVKETLKEIEGVTATRVRLGGAIEDRFTGNMVAAVVTHDTSRALDPQLHTHVCVMNVTHDAVENRWKAVEPRGFYKYQSYLREVSYNKLAEKMKEGGYEIEKARSGGFNIKGFPNKLREDFSKRREEIERVADVLKTRNQDALQSIAIRTRAEKTHRKSEELKARWLSEAKVHLPKIQQIIASSKPTGELTKIAASRFLALGEEHVFERQSVVDERILLREALIAGRGEVRLDQLRDSLASRLQSGDLIQNGRMITSRETLAMEKSVVEWAANSKDCFPKMGSFTPQESLSTEQNRAAEKLLATKDRAVVLIGDAGAGKSTTLSLIVRGIHETGNLTFACAPSSGAVQELREKLNIQADTIQQLLVNERLQEQMAGRTIIVDEAGLLSIRQIQALCQLAERQKCRLLLVGDVKQHHSVEAGDALRALQKFAGIEAVRLKEIHRQENEAYRKVVRLLASGKAHAAFGQLDRLGGVREQKDWNKLLDQAASTYLDNVKAGQSCLAISPVWSEVNAFTGVLRERLKEQGLLGKVEHSYKAVQSLQWTRSLKMQLSNYQIGDVVTFHRDGGGFSKHDMGTVVRKEDGGLILERADGAKMRFDPRERGHFDVGLSRSLSVSDGEKLLVRANFAPSGLKNGDLVTVQEVKSDGSFVLRDGRIIPNHFRQFTHGYASTSHAAQGKTVDHGILLIGEKGVKASNLKQAYVSNSRFRQSQAIFTTDKQTAFDSMAKENERPLALETVRSVPQETSPMQNATTPVVAMVDNTRRKVKSVALDWTPLGTKPKLTIN
jgi:conjugative relaxase-like TrwC/TraI family protein